MREFDEDDGPIPGVIVRLQKTDGPFAMVLTTETDTNGFYQFTEQAGVNLLPGGIYKVTEIQPAILVDGRESASTGISNSPADPVIVGNDVFSNMVLDPGAVATEFNFGELGLRAEFVLDFLFGRVFLASSGSDGITTASGVLSSIDLTQGDVLVSFDAGWEGTMTASAKTSDASGEVVLTLLDENAKTLDSTHSTGGVAELTVEGTPGEARFLRLSGNHSNVSLNLLGGVSDSTAPEARLHPMANVVAGGATEGRLTITFEDDMAVDVASIDSRDVRVLGPGGYSALATANLSSGAASGQTLTVDYTINPPGGFWNAADSGTYRIQIEPNQVTDISGNAVAARVLGSFTVDVDPTIPIAVDVLYSAVEDTQLSIIAESGLLSHLDSSEPFAALPVNGPQHGILALDPNGAFTYNPSPNFFGIDTFTYQITSGSRVGNTALVTIQVSNTNDAPRAFDDAFATVTGEILDAGLERLVASGDLWQFLDDGSNQATAWQTPQFDDGLWSEGRSQLGWGDGDEATTVSFGDDAEDKHVTTYFRRTFKVTGAADVDALYLHLIRDDGAAVYLNGVEIARDNVAEDATYDTLANEKTRREAEQIFHVYTVDPSLLVEGDNLLAVEVHQWRPGTSDMSMDARLTAVREPFVGTLANDVDIDGDVLEAQVTSGPSNGLLTFNPNGTFVYVPEADFIGTDSFRYLASDGQSQSNESVVTINVRPRPTGSLSDLTGNGFVDFEDLTVLLANWNQNVSVAEGNLVDAVGTPVNFQDLTVLLAAWTGPGPAASPQPAATEATVQRNTATSARFDQLTRRSYTPSRRIDPSTKLSSHDSPLRRLQAAAVDRAMGEDFEWTLTRRGSAFVRRRR